MAIQESLLERPRNSATKTICLIFSLAALICSSVFAASYFIKPSSFLNQSSPQHLCHHALDNPSCLAHLSEVVQGPIFTTTKDHSFNLFHSFLLKSTSHIQRAMNTASSIKLRVNSPKEEAALNDCVELMDLSIDRVLDSMLTLTNQTTESQQDAHTWLSSVLTNHATCLDGLEGTARALMEAELEDLISRARTALAMFVTVLPPRVEPIDEPLNGEFPSWLSSKDRRLLESSVGDINANVVVAKDGSGKFKTVAEAVASAPDNSKTRYVIYVKKGTYKENVEIGKKKKNVMLVGDGKDLTVITSKYPEMMLGYNLSPSFNWDASGMSDEQMRDFIPKIAKLGYVWQFITVGGLHSNALITSTFSRDFANRGMLAYVERIQREERNNGVDTLAHQKWAGANYYDRYLKTVQGGVASTAAMGKGVTEDQFKESWTRPGAVDIDRGSIVVAKARM